MTPQTAEDSSHSYLSSEAERAHVPTSVPFRNYERRLYDVEIAFQPNGDVVYHFFPKKGSFEFSFGEKVVGMILEDAFVWAVGKGIDAEADYFGRHIVQHFVRANDPTRSLGQPTFCITVPKVGNRLGAESLLIDRFLGRLDSLLERAASYSLGGEAVRLEKDLRAKRWRD